MRINTVLVRCVRILAGRSSPVRKLAALMLAGLAVIGVWWAQPGEAARFSATVIGVSDGDTITVLDSRREPVRVRLAFIDAPERRQPYGQKARELLAGKLFRQSVDVEVIDHDRYGRIVGRVRMNGVDVDFLMVAAGFAWHYRQFARLQPAGDFQRYAAAEAAARERHLGLWADARPQPPWDFRRATNRPGWMVEE